MVKLSGVRLGLRCLGAVTGPVVRRPGGGRALRTWLAGAALGLGLSMAQGAPTTGAEAGADAGAAAANPGRTGAGQASPQISTGNRHLDILLEAGATGGATGGAGTGTGSAAKERGAAASLPGLREANLRQTMRAEAALEAEAKSGKRGGNAATSDEIGTRDSVLRPDSAQADPTAKRRWENPAQAAEGNQDKPAAEETPAVVLLFREWVDYLRSHRVELFALLGLLAVLALLLKLYIRRS